MVKKRGLSKAVACGFGLSLVALLMLATVSAAWGAETRNAQKITVAEGQTVNDDLYAAGNVVTINGLVTGDLVAVGQRIVINGIVNGDVMGLAQTVIINGHVGSGVRVACQAVRVGKHGNIEGDMLSADYSLEMQPGSHVGGDLFSAGYKGLIWGDIGGKVKAAYTALQLEGTVRRDMEVWAGDTQDQSGPPPSAFMPESTIAMPSVPIGLTLGKDARVGGKLVYTAKKPAKIKPGAKVAGSIQHKLPKPEPGAKQAQKETVGSWALNQVRRLVALVLLGLLLVWLVPGWLTAVGEKIEAKPAPSLGWGLIAFFAFVGAVLGVLFATILLAILFGVATIGDVVTTVLVSGVLAEVVLCIGYALFVAVGAPTIAGLLGGRLVLGRVQPDAADKRFLAFLAGIVLLWVLTAIPVFGTAVSLLVTVAALGGLWMWGRERMRGTSSQEPATEA